MAAPVSFMSEPDPGEIIEACRKGQLTAEVQVALLLRSLLQMIELLGEGMHAVDPKAATSADTQSLIRSYSERVRNGMESVLITLYTAAPEDEKDAVLVIYNEALSRAGGDSVRDDSGERPDRPS